MPQFPRFFSTFSVFTVLDVLLVAFIFYWLLTAIRGTRAIPLVRGIFIILFASIVLGTALQFTTLNWLIRNSIPALLIAVPVIFQPELRRGLEQLGRSRSTRFWTRSLGNPVATIIINNIREIAKACEQFSIRRYGALIVWERQTGLQEYADKGIKVDGLVSAELLASIFYPDSPLHDGAVIIRNDRIISASCVLPLSEAILANRHSGMRHRAAMGVSEHSDALVIIVSEENGEISMASDGRLTILPSIDNLKSILVNTFKLTRKKGNRFGKEG